MVVEELTEELRQSEKAAYEKLVRLMSHEVGNTVGAGRSLLESCLAYGRHLPEAERRDFEEALSVVISRLGQLQEFTRGFAEVVRLPPPRLGPCDLGVVARAVATLLRPAAVAPPRRRPYGGASPRHIRSTAIPVPRPARNTPPKQPNQEVSR